LSCPVIALQKTTHLLAGHEYTGVKPNPVWPYRFWRFAPKACILESCIQGSVAAYNRRRKKTNERVIGK